MDMDLTIEMLSSCAVCGEASMGLGGTAVVFQVRSPNGHAGTFTAHATCVIRTMHPTVRALLDSTPPIPAGESPHAIELITVEHHGPLAVTVALYPHDHLDREGPEAHRLLADAQTRLTPGMAMAGNAHNQQIPPGLSLPLVTFYFGPEHVPDPMWEIRDWLLAHPLARVIEIESHIPDTRAT
jgi:hypothetical protein